jgi:replication factor C subunit 2/4
MSYALLSPIIYSRRQLYQTVIYNENIPDVQKNKITLLFSESDKRLVDGSDEHLTILDLALRISNVMGGA